ncbi:MAG: hypothetical protein LBS30_07840, partial [Planctomycetota bacterium]|nr:hypothetical protein [Planctomycetota bacterium]
MKNVVLTAILLACLSAMTAGCATFPIRGRQVLRALCHCESASHPVGSPAFEAALDALLGTGAAAHPDSRAKLLQNGDEAYPVMLKLIAEARERISLEMYIVDKNHITDEFFD